MFIWQESVEERLRGRGSAIFPEHRWPYIRGWSPYRRLKYDNGETVSHLPCLMISTGLVERW
jgi:hypothetical protein